MVDYNSIASTYDDWYETKIGSFVNRIETNAMLKLLIPSPGMHILDVGCGTGVFSFSLADFGYQVTGIDQSGEMLRMARLKSQNKPYSIRFKKDDALNLSFPDESFDAVVSLVALEFVSDARKMMGEAYRVVKHGGEIVIGTINKDSAWGKVYASQKESIYDSATFKTKEDIRGLLDEEPQAIEEHLFIPPDVDESNADLRKKNENEDEREGGFICAMWVK